MTSEPGGPVWRTEPLEGGIGDRYPQSSVSALATSDSAVWIVPRALPEIQRLDPATNDVITVETGPIGAPVDIQAAGGSVWVVGGNDWVQRIDPDQSAIVETFDGIVGGFSLAASDTSLWVVTDEGNSLTRIDLASSEVTGPFAFSGVRHFFEPNIAATDTSVWIADLRDDSGVSVLRVDPATGRVDTVLTDPTSSTPAAVVAVDGTVWALFEGELIQLDPVTGQRVRALPAAAPAPWGSFDRTVGVVGIAATNDGVWFGDTDGNASFVDQATGDVTRTVEVDVPTSFRLLGATTDALWLVDQGLGDDWPEAVLTRVDLP